MSSKCNKITTENCQRCLGKVSGNLKQAGDLLFEITTGLNFLQAITSPSHDFTFPWFHLPMISPSHEFTFPWFHLPMISPSHDFTFQGFTFRDFTFRDFPLKQCTPHTTATSSPSDLYSLTCNTIWRNVKTQVKVLIKSCCKHHRPTLEES